MRAILTCALVAFCIAGGDFLSDSSARSCRVHDEFSYLLAADTFAERQDLEQPFAPACGNTSNRSTSSNSRLVRTQNINLDRGWCWPLGQIVGGHPIVGAWIASALAAAAMCAGCCKGGCLARWALLGGLVGRAAWRDPSALVAYAIGAAASPWSGGALMFGALPRIMRRCPTVVDFFAAWRSECMYCSPLTRPFEGFIVGLTITWR